MASNWIETTLGGIADPCGGVVDGPFGSNLPASGYVTEGIPVIRGSNLSLGKEKFKQHEFVYISQDAFEKLQRSECLPNDIIFTKKGTLGQTGIIPNPSIFTRYILSSNQMRLRVDPLKALPAYIYYVVSSPQTIEKIIRDSDCTGVPKINLEYLRKFPVKLPDLKTQKAIAHILGSLDDKIELNRQMNETLEAMAQALFKSWFVDFDPVIDNALAAGNAIPDELFERAEQRKGIEKKDNADIQGLFPDEFEFTEEMGWIPKGWGVKSLDEVADYLNGLALQKYRPEDIDDNYLPIVKIAQLREGLPNHDEKASINIKPEYIIDNGDVIFSWSGSLLVDVWCGGKAALNQHLFKVTSDKYPKWFYLNYTKHHLVEFQRIATDKAVTMGHIKRGHLKEALCVIPENGVDDNIFAVFEGILNKQIRLRIESQTLAKLRDTLLPKLMSGELRIQDAEALVDEVL